MNKEMENKYIERMNESLKINRDDNEDLHIEFDRLLLDILEELGYKEIVKLYDKTSAEITFWHA